jgi:uncharacterized membrane protein YqjE
VTSEQPQPTGVKGFLSLLFEQVSELARLYATSARQEVEEGLNQLKIALIFFGITVALLAVGAMVLVILFVATVSAITGLPMWATALFVLFIVVALAAIFGWLGYRRVSRARLMPEETIASAKEDLEWAQHLTRRD